MFPDRGGRHLRDRRNGARRKETRTRRPMERRRVGRRGTKAYRVARRGDVCKHRVKQMSTILRRSSTRLYSATGTALRFRSRPPMEAKRLGPDAGPEIRPSQRHLAGVGPTPSTPAGSARAERADTPRGDSAGEVADRGRVCSRPLSTTAAGRPKCRDGRECCCLVRAKERDGPSMAPPAFASLSCAERGRARGGWPGTTLPEQGMMHGMGEGARRGSR